jgi:hypothetical protein
MSACPLPARPWPCSRRGPQAAICRPRPGPLLLAAGWAALLFVVCCLLLRPAGPAHRVFGSNRPGDHRAITGGGPGLCPARRVCSSGEFGSHRPSCFCQCNFCFSHPTPPCCRYKLKKKGGGGGARTFLHQLGGAACWALGGLDMRGCFGPE